MTGSRAHRLAQWMEERLGWRSVQVQIDHKEVPRHRHTLWYYFGGMTLFLFVIQVGTGILLLLYYRPSAESAFESVQFIMTEVYAFGSSVNGTVPVLKLEKPRAHEEKDGNADTILPFPLAELLHLAYETEPKLRANREMLYTIQELLDPLFSRPVGTYAFFCIQHNGLYTQQHPRH